MSKPKLTPEPMATITIIHEEGIPGRLAPFVFAYQEFTGDEETRCRFDADTCKMRWCGRGMWDPELVQPPINHKQIEGVLRGYVESLGYVVVK